MQRVRRCSLPSAPVCDVEGSGLEHETGLWPSRNLTFTCHSEESRQRRGDEESAGWSRLLRFFVACRLLRMTMNGESLSLEINNFKLSKGAPDEKRKKHETEMELAKKD
mgnify:CR=1 FL=1